jgi:hypothetical protein
MMDRLSNEEVKRYERTGQEDDSWWERMLA